jgi:hypothetical protein
LAGCGVKIKLHNVKADTDIVNPTVGIGYHLDQCFAIPSCDFCRLVNKLRCFPIKLGVVIAGNTLETWILHCFIAFFYEFMLL